MSELYKNKKAMNERESQPNFSSCLFRRFRRSGKPSKFSLPFLLLSSSSFYFFFLGILFLSFGIRVYNLEMANITRISKLDEAQQKLKESSDRH